ncbi:MAG TPA: MoxR family ATPase [Dehalococcoidales bacterium]|nr:MAG: AAA family ATPase [Chloroflexi bacterium RBG_16_60_22]HJX13710.1 MoxR family ATPase [Dehalococcoidales bacterium]
MDRTITRAQALAEKIIDNIEKVLVGKREAVELAVIALISQGHLLIEDAPGVGKTMLARSLAKSIHCNFKRIQFTPDMLPGDITGVTVYNQKIGDFEFRPGPIMAQVVLADEINRATPKVQSALLEAMAEGQITVDGVTHQMPSPFHVLATQSPVEYEGTFPLPEAQLDRFLLRINIGYPSPDEEIAVIERQQFVHPIEEIEPVVAAEDILMLQETVKKIYVDNLIKHYIVALVDATRHHPAIYLGASPRGSLALFRTAQARALLDGRDYVLPDDVKSLAESTLAHRSLPSSTDPALGRDGRASIAAILETVPVPGAIPGRK